MGDRPRPDRLELSPEAMRRLGYAIVDRIVDHVADARATPPLVPTRRSELDALIARPLPEDGEDPLAVVDDAVNEVLARVAHVDHPRFFAFVPGPSNFVGAMADALASGWNVFAGTWLGGAGAAAVELATIDWLRRECGLPAGAGGLFVSGGSLANLLGLAVARDERLDESERASAVIYVGDQAHAAVTRAAHLLGFGARQLRVVAGDETFRLSVDAVRRAIVDDLAAGRRPFCLVATAGTTNTGAVDPLVELGALCREEGLWLHVDGAYGAAAVVCEEGRAALTGLDAADSLALDPHKWLFQPFEIGCVLVRDAKALARTFATRPDYMRDVPLEETEVSFSDFGIQLSRSFRALKLWMSLRVFGLRAVRSAVARGFDTARAAEALLRESGVFEIVTPARMAILTFRLIDDGRGPEATDEQTRRLVDAVNAGGQTMLSSTLLDGRTALRLCTINPRTTEADLRLSIAALVEAAGRLAGQAG